jgi:hypothetical protein
MYTDIFSLKKHIYNNVYCYSTYHASSLHKAWSSCCPKVDCTTTAPKIAGERGTVPLCLRSLRALKMDAQRCSNDSMRGDEVNSELQVSWSVVLKRSQHSLKYTASDKNAYATRFAALDTISRICIG